MKTEPDPPPLSESAFPEGTRFFSDDGEPVAMIPGVGPVNFWGSRGVEIPMTEFGRNNPVRSLSWHEFLAKAGEECVRHWLIARLIHDAAAQPASSPEAQNEPDKKPRTIPLRSSYPDEASYNAAMKAHWDAAEDAEPDPKMLAAVREAAEKIFGALPAATDEQAEPAKNPLEMPFPENFPDEASYNAAMKEYWEAVEDEEPDPAILAAVKKAAEKVFGSSPEA